MSELFIGVLNLSLKASWLILAVIFLRWVFCRAQKRLTCFLWLLCGIRLAVPFSFESVLSLVPSARTVPPEIVTAEIPQIHSGIAALNSAVNPVLSQNFTAAESGSNALQTVVAVSAAVWLAVTLALVIYGAVSYAALVGKMSDAVLLRNNIFQSEKAPTPFILGFVRPKIYIPYGLSAEDESSVTAHENAHITRRDHIIKPLWYLLLCVHWFNPLVWIAYTLLCRDIELACDEMAVRGMNEEKRKMYAVALLHCAADGKRIAACPLAFGEAGIKERVKSVMNYKKPAFWIVLAAVLASVAVAVGFLTDPVIVPADAGKNFICTDSGTDNENVGFSLGNVEFSDGILKITTYFDNQTESDMTFGEEFHLYYTGKGEAGEKTLCDPKNYSWNDIANLVPAHTNREKQYSLEGFYTDRLGKYRLEMKFHIDGKEYNGWLEFELADKTVPRGYFEAPAAGMIYSDGAYGSLIYTEDNMPVFEITDKLVLRDPRADEEIGQLTEIDMTRRKMNRLMNNSGMWYDGMSPGELYRGAVRFFECVQKMKDSDDSYYYLVLTKKDGSVYLGKGYEDKAGERRIRWVFQLAFPEYEQIDGEKSYLLGEAVFERANRNLKYGQSSRQFFIENDRLYSVDENSNSRSFLGMLERQKIGLNFLLGKEQWKKGFSKNKIIKGISHVKFCRVSVSAETGTEYYIYMLCRKNGEVLFGYGTENEIDLLFESAETDQGVISPQKDSASTTAREK